MKISYNWLSDYIKIPYTAEELADKLTKCGIEVEGIEKKGIVPDGIIVAEILERKQHPNADKLSVCTVDTGKEKLQIVCGAPNCDAGHKVPLATIGTVFNDPETGKAFNIGKCKLRGVESFGMICSERELGLSDSHGGIMVLPKDAPLGIPLKEFLKGDIVYELEITPNRPDCLSFWGIAREIGALSGKELKKPEILVPAGSEVPAEKTKDLVEIRDLDLCPRYTARIIRNVKVKESPDWLKEKLQSIGLRPINNIVDITNFVLMELGQPLHAFDLEQLAGPKIIVRRAYENEKIMTLDGKEYKLSKQNLVIADADKPVALAGVMGGEHSGVTDQTVSILLESAYFDPKNIRTTSRELGLSSDSSYRFERGVDWEMVDVASNRAISLILELAGGEVVTGLIDVKKDPRKPVRITCRFEKLRNFLGVGISDKEIIDIFTELHFKVDKINDGKCVVIPPSFRGDIEREADLAEEIARINGLDKIPVLPVKATSGGTLAEDSYVGTQNTKNLLISLGLSECLNYSFADEKTALLDVRFSKNDLVEMANPVSRDFAYLRPSLFAGLLTNVEYNISRKNYDLAVFETGTVFCSNKALFPEERQECCIVLTGRKHPELYSAEKNELYDFYDMKGLLESWMDTARVKYSFKEADSGLFAAGSSAVMAVNGKEAAVFGELNGKYTAKYRTQYPVFVAVVQLDVIFGCEPGKLLFKPFSQFPSVTRDVAFLADESLRHEAVMDFINGSGLENLEKVELFDIFRDKNMEGGSKSMAYTLTFRNFERTLTDDEVNASYEKIREKLASGLKVALR